jgi:hypothetical protein
MSKAFSDQGSQAAVEITAGCMDKSFIIIILC